MAKNNDTFNTYQELNEAKLDHLMRAVEGGAVPAELRAAQASLLEKIKTEQAAYRSGFFEDEDILVMPSMGVLEIKRETLDQPRFLFATDIKTPTLVRIRLHRAHLVKETGEVVCDELLSDIIMSEMQLGEILINSNTGEGFPVTIEALNGEEVPEYDPILDASKQRLALLRNKISSTCPQVDRFISEIESTLSGAEDKGRASKADIAEMAKKLSCLSGYTVMNSVHDLEILGEELHHRINEASLNLHLTTNKLALEHKE